MIYIEKKKQYRTIFILLLVILFLAMLFSCSVGAANLTMVESFKIISSKIPIIGSLVDDEELLASSAYKIIWKLRMPRVLLAGIVGGALAFSGATYQGLFKNPMAESYVLGVSAGAALGGTISIIMGITGVAGLGGTGLMAFIGALLATFLVYRLAQVGGRVSMTTLLLSGIAVNFMLSAIVSLLMILNRQRMDNVIRWTMGSFSTATWEKVAMASITLITGMVITTFYAKDLNLLLMGEEQAKYLGVEVEKTKKALLGLSSFIAAMAVSVSGIIGFVGLIIPHALRTVIGPDHRVVLPYTAVVGGIFLVLADTLARTLISPGELPVGVITALTGAPFFLYLLAKNKRQV